jgi:competence protein ComEC
MQKLFGIIFLALPLVAWSQTAPEPAMPAYGCVDLNVASLDELRLIFYIDEQRAEQIIEFREERPFETVADLLVLPGIGEEQLDYILEEGVACVLTEEEREEQARSR